MKKPDDLYFIALIPPEPIYTQVYKVKEEVAKSYNSKAALKSPPHITLHMPFKIRSNKIEALEMALVEFSKNLTVFEVVLSNFSHFGERVIFIDVLHSKPLSDLQSDLNKLMKLNFNIFNSTHKDNGFHPHMTIAFRDLKKDQFRKAWEYFNNEKLHEPFDVRQLTLLKHNGLKWEEHKHFPFKNDN